MIFLIFHASEARGKMSVTIYYFESQDVFKKVHVPWVNALKKTLCPMHIGFKKSSCPMPICTGTIPVINIDRSLSI